MAEYEVSWSINVDDETPEKAAEQAWSMIQDPHSTATIFVVEADQHFWPGHHEKWVIDVEIPGEPVLIRHEINGEKVT